MVDLQASGQPHCRASSRLLCVTTTGCSRDDDNVSGTMTKASNFIVASLPSLLGATRWRFPPRGSTAAKCRRSLAQELLLSPSWSWQQDSDHATHGICPPVRVKSLMTKGPGALWED
ncbi:hypothetical protein IG631_09344 [Alternaria alternata]|nr:hypothetical protein IG631_09344 [Alternaria alternata]